MNRSSGRKSTPHPKTTTGKAAEALPGSQPVVAEVYKIQPEAGKPAAEALPGSKQDLPQAIKEKVDTMAEETRTTPPPAAEPAAKVVEEKKAAEVPAAKSESKPDPAPEAHRPVRPEVRPHAFVVMPFGKKKGGDGSLYDFNAIYYNLLKPTLESAGFEPFRADEATTSGDILTDMFQELLLADLVLCDLSIDNANAFYELGIRHAFRKRGVVHIQAGRSYMPFDIFNVRTIPYHVTAEGVPDPETIEKDKQAIARVCRDTWASDPDAIHSPIFNLLPGLIEPERSTLRTPLATGFWRDYNEWKDRVTIAKRRQRIGDILLLTEEITNPMIKEEAVGEAGRALQDMQRFDLSLKQYQKGLELNPRNLRFRRQEAIILNRLGRIEDAIVKLENLLNQHPDDTEAIGTLGRIYKDMWNNSWKWIKEDPAKRLKTAYESYHWLLKAFQTYLRGYQYDLDNTYLGVNALTLGTALISLADRFEEKEDPDPDLVKVRLILPELRSTLLFGLEHKTLDEKADYWDLASLGELQVNTADRVQKVVRAYRKALTAARGNLFSLQSSMNQLETLCILDIRTEFATAGIKVIKDELQRIRKQDEDDLPVAKTAAYAPSAPSEARAFLFTGYMVDYSRKNEQHFPPDREIDFKEAIAKVLDKYQVGEHDLAFTAGMSGGCELLFIEACLERGLRVKTHMPVPEAQYIRDFVAPCGDTWVERFYKARNHPLCDEFYQPDNVGVVKKGDDANERNNRWALYSSFELGADQVRLIAVWDGKGDVPRDQDARLVKHMVDLMRDMGGQVEHIHSAKMLAETGAALAERKAKQGK
jgi:tetratricopeptide (TPR) repeat protein